MWTRLLTCEFYYRKSVCNALLGGNPVIISLDTSFWAGRFSQKSCLWPGGNSLAVQVISPETRQEGTWGKMGMGRSQHPCAFIQDYSTPFILSVFYPILQIICVLLKRFCALIFSENNLPVIWQRQRGNLDTFFFSAPHFKRHIVLPIPEWSLGILWYKLMSSFFHCCYRVLFSWDY